MNLLITQCLQKDFVQPISKTDMLPNDLHIGYSESRRLIGADFEDLVESMRASNVQLIHIRDWHSPEDSEQSEHLQRFGNHCIQGSDGASFVFNTDERDVIVDATTLNDFHHTTLKSELEPFAQEEMHVDVVGVWTEAKITFLLYELLTRYPNFKLATCSALTASSSRHKHFLALDHIESILGVTVFDSVGEFTEFLTGNSSVIAPERITSNIEFRSKDGFSDEEKSLMQLLFKDSKDVHYQLLDGGFSGNRVLLVTSKDIHGHEQTPHVVKIGHRTEIANERISFEKIETVMGNNAPQVVDFIDLAEKGAIKYRYASMSGGSPVTLQKLYQIGERLDVIFMYLDEVFAKQLNRFYKAAMPESVNLMDYYQFSPKWANSVAQKVANITGLEQSAGKITFENGKTLKTINLFYSDFLNRHQELTSEYHWSFIHGDLNGANVLIESQNVWLIDFFHTHRGHVLKDLIKFENDLLYIFTDIADEESLKMAYQFSDAIYSISSLHDIAPVEAEIFRANDCLYRAAKTVNKLRSFIPDLVGELDDIRQLRMGQLRYAVHTLGFDECNKYQKKWALYSACILAELVSANS